MNIDFHAHILPGADHGSDSVVTSLSQLTMAKTAGVDLVVATPHFYPHTDTLEEFLQRREQTYAKLSAALEKRKLPKVILGAEAFICDGMEKMDGLEQLCIAGTNVLLLEMPFAAWKSSYLATIGQIQSERRIQVVLAHVDRYPPQQVDSLLRLGLKCQLNAEGILRFFSRKRYTQLMESGKCVAIGSDIHGTEIGYRDYIKAREIYQKQWNRVMTRTEVLISASNHD